MKNHTCKMFLVLSVFAAALFLPHTVFCAGFPQPTVEYSADRVIAGDGGKEHVYKIYSAPGKERMETKEGSGGAMIITRMDKKLVWTLMPSQKMYMETKFSGQGASRQKQAGFDQEKCDVRQTEKGKEDVNGFPTRKMELAISCPGEEKYTGFVWLTKENIAMRMETSKAGKKETTRLELKNLKIGKQDPALFEVPAGYKSLAMPIMPKQ